MHMKTALAGLCLAIALSPVHARAADWLPSWNDGASKARIVDFVQSVTDPTSQQY